MEKFLEDFLQNYQRLDDQNLNLLPTMYTEGIRFVDPAHEIIGIDALHQYFKNLYANVEEINFSFSSPLTGDREAYIRWTFHFLHQRLKKNGSITVNGASYLRFADGYRVCYHRDYFDLGELVYEQLPVLGKMVKTIKKRLGR